MPQGLGDQSSRVFSNPGQRKVLESGILASGFSCILQMPTGSGKTWLAEQAIADTLSYHRRAIYLAPLRALAAELHARWTDQFSDHSVGIFTGDFFSTHSRPPVPFSQAELLIMTPERLDACTRMWRSHWDWITETDLLVVDEIHLLGEPQRGPRLEGAILRLKRLNPFLRVLGLSATLGNREELARWLDGIEFCSDWRAVPLAWRSRCFRKPDEKPAMLIEEVSSCVSNGGKSLVFVQSRRRAEQLAELLRNHGISASHHHAGLSSDTRSEVEAGFRGQQLDVLLSTGTLEMGLNLPVRQVVLYDLQAFDGTDFSQLPVNTVWQRAGRAGRPGLDANGEAVLFAPVWDKQAKSYEKGDFDPILSGLSNSLALAEQILAEIGSGLCRKEEQLFRALHQSLGHHQKRLPSIHATLSKMLESGMIAEVQAEDIGKPPLLKATRLGRIAIRQMLLPDAVLHLHRALTGENSHQLTFLDLLLIATSAPGFEPLLPCDFEDLDVLSQQLAKERSHLLQGTNDFIADRISTQGRRLIAIIKTSLVARSWTRVGDVETVADMWNCYPFEVRRLSENIARMMSAMSTMLSKPKNADATPDSPLPSAPDDFVPLSERARILLAMVTNGLTETAATLTYIPGIGPRLARRLVSAGIKDIEDLAQSEPERIADIRGVSIKRASSWIDTASELLVEFAPNRLKELGPTVGLRQDSWPDGIDPYRLGRALELNVKARGNNRFHVTGGLDPHQVILSSDGSSHKCDCADFSSGHICKHILAARLKVGDTELQATAERLSASISPDSIDLHCLWLDSRR